MKQTQQKTIRNRRLSHWMALVGTGLFLLAGQAVWAQGATRSSLTNQLAWYVNANGFQSLLIITSVNDRDGTVTGTIRDDNGQLPLQNAKWDENARRLIFTRTLPNGEGQTFTGLLFDSPGGSGYAAVMAGMFTGDHFEDPRRPAFGWYALATPRIIP